VPKFNHRARLATQPLTSGRLTPSSAPDRVAPEIVALSPLVLHETGLPSPADRNRVASALAPLSQSVKILSQPTLVSASC